MASQDMHNRRGATLVELLLTMSISIVLFGGIASAIMLASHALPDENDAFIAITDSAAISEQISTELYSAITVTERSPTAITFTTADRNLDNNPESIRYYWSGVPGDPLTRQYNAFPAKVVTSSVFDFNLNYNIDISSKLVTHETIVYGPNQLLASFESWPAVADVFEQVIKSTSWISQYFEIVAPPEATTLVITSAKIKILSYILPSSAITLGIHRSTLDGTYVPEINSIGSEAVIPQNVLDANPLWMTATFSDVIILDPQRTDYSLVMKGFTSDSVYAVYLFQRKAPPNGTIMKWTNDSGGIWSPANKDINKQDLLFYVYGAYGTTSTVTDPVNRYFLKSVDLSLQLTENPTTNVITSVQVLNTPEIVP